jgi:hypothetical protein
MRRTFGDLVLLVLAALFVLFVAFLMFLPSMHRVDRRIGMIGGAEMLLWAYDGYTNSGVLTNSSGVWLSSNTVTISGTQYQCLLETRPPRIESEGTLAMTSNRIFIWLPSNAPPKIIRPGSEH